MEKSEITRFFSLFLSKLITCTVPLFIHLLSVHIFPHTILQLYNSFPCPLGQYFITLPVSFCNSFLYSLPVKSVPPQEDDDKRMTKVVRRGLVSRIIVRATSPLFHFPSRHYYASPLSTRPCYFLCLAFTWNMNELT